MKKNLNDIPFLKILANSWQIAWKNRYLWWFGFFIVISNIGSFAYYFGDNENKNSYAVEPQKIIDFISQNIQWFIILVITLIIFYIIFIILGLISRGALIDSIEKNFKKQEANFKSAFKEGKKNFGKIFSIALALGLFIFLTIIVLAVPVALLLLNQNYLLGFFVAFLAFIIFIPLMFLANFMRLYGYIYAVLGGLNFKDSLENACSLFRKNILSSIIMGLFFIPINIAVAMIFFALIFILAIIFLGVGLVFYFLAGKIGVIIIAVMGLISFLLAILIIQSIYQVFSQAVWIFFFHEIASPKLPEVVTETEIETETISKPMPVIESKKEN